MSVDLSQFLQTFFEESFEGLDTMESGLLELDPQQPDKENLNTVFRAAHSIKGGAGTFGLTAISDFTHRMETLLDRLRSGEQAVTAEAVSALLSAVDCLRSMLEAIQADQQLDSDALSAAQRSLDEQLAIGSSGTGSNGKDGGAASSPGADSNGAAAGGARSGGDGSAGAGGGKGNGDNHHGWRIHFEPEPHLLTTGNDPARLFRALADLGELKVECNSSGLVPFEELDPESCYLSWDLQLHGKVSREDIREVFEWVEDDAVIEIEPLAGKAQSSASAAKDEELEQANESHSAAGGDAPAAASVPANQSANAADAAPATDAKASAAKAQAGAKGGDGTAKKSKSSSSIRVDTGKIDALIDMVGELVITQSMLSQIGKEFTQERLEELQDGLAQLERNTRELQESVMRIRMVPISFAYSRLPRIVHDTSRALGKEVDFNMEGEQTELDKTVMEKIIDPLVHLVRNSVDHGIEMPEERQALGKPQKGQITIDAYHKGGNIIIEIGDDGKGIDRDKLLNKARQAGLVEDGAELADSEVFDLIFHPGLSTHDQATEYSGRGVGMDVVKRNIRSLSGSLNVRSSAGVGTTITISLPLTLSILDGQLFRVGDQTFIVPLVSVIESLQIDSSKVSRVTSRGEVYHWREGYVPIVRLHELFDTEPSRNELAGGLMVIVEDEDSYIGVFVDDLLDQQQVVIKSLEANYLRVPGIAGATILGDGTVALILDIAGLVEMSRGGPRQPVIPEREEAD
ncbi:signal transduction histidine kinase CheA [Halorhodospira halochloris]|uniref:Chemotaxis protein CheA n=1 Tax=Halorhodospira halochloris TaxID=1052 RepID=A0A0X8X674_HALHR|nr:chemotaxis protein CheA [Halorhodospira halochloris]MBK1652473.1 chemotaxis protein CheA [Halorhodospira halochloris]MCG5547452.1 chemotaxis protein CheA [Halorhodospira halochloris]BAU56369.1 signal transduction histidine kinase CheA [Halorhodospira halochloris]